MHQPHVSRSPALSARLRPWLLALPLLAAALPPATAFAAAPSAAAKQNPRAHWFDYDRHRFWYRPEGNVLIWDPAPAAVAYDVYLIRYLDEGMTRAALLGATHRGVVRVEVPAEHHQFIDYVAPMEERAYDVLGYYYVAVFARSEDGRRTEVLWRNVRLSEATIDNPYVHRFLPDMHWLRVWPDGEGVFVAWEPPPGWLPAPARYELYVARRYHGAQTAESLDEHRRAVFDGQVEDARRYDLDGMATSLAFPGFDAYYVLVIAVDAEGRRYDVTHLAARRLGEVPEGERGGAYHRDGDRFVAPAR